VSPRAQAALGKRDPADRATPIAKKIRDWGCPEQRYTIMTGARRLGRLQSWPDRRVLSDLVFPITSLNGETVDSRRFFCDEDCQSYLELMGHWCDAHNLEIWAYCLLPNHVHLIAVPQTSMV
jgi:hypothetical protein